MAVKDMVGHISLFFEIVNKNTPLTYVNMEEASTALYTFLRRFHESKNAKHRVKDKDCDMSKFLIDGRMNLNNEQIFNPNMQFFPKMEPHFAMNEESNN